MNKETAVELIQGYLKANKFTEPCETLDEILENAREVEEYGYDSRKNSAYYEDPVDYNGWVMNVEQKFGGEGQGDYIWIVFEMQKGDSEHFYFRISGNYDSWNDTEWEELDLVEPKEYTAIRWERIKNSD